MRNQKLWDIALTRALQSHLSDYDGTKPNETLAEIESFGHKCVGSETITIWERFEYWSGTDIADAVVSEADAHMEAFVLVAEAYLDSDPTGEARSYLTDAKEWVVGK